MQPFKIMLNLQMLWSIKMINKETIWNEEQINILHSYLLENVDKDYQAFSRKLIFTQYEILGIRTPILKKIAKEISKTDIELFLKNWNAKAYEEILLEGFVIGYIKDIQPSIYHFNQYIKKIDNWALCDQVVSTMKIVKKNKEFFFKQIKKYIDSKKEFTVRVGIILLLDYYIEKDYLQKIFIITEKLNREEYYIKMAVAWLLSICYIKYREETLSYLKTSNLDKFTYNKTISKIRDSYRVTQEEKDNLQKLKK